MPNMSYCRFENTLGDLKDCWDNWDEATSSSEIESRRKMLKLIKRIASEFEDEE